MKNQNPLRISHESLNLDDIISDLNDGNLQVNTTNVNQTNSLIQNDYNAFNSKTGYQNTYQFQQDEYSSHPSLMNNQSTTIESTNRSNNPSINNIASTTKSVTKELKSTKSTSQQQDSTKNSQNTTNKVGINSSAGIAKTQSKARLGASNTTNTKEMLNKENTSKNGNQSQIDQNKNGLIIEGEKKNTVQRDYLVSTTTETVTNKDLNTNNMLINDRYIDSSSKFDSMSNLHNYDQDSMVNQTTPQADQMPFYLQKFQQQPQIPNNQQAFSQLSNADEDVENFQKKLDTLIINFRSETMSEFMRTKKQVLTEQSATIEAERRRCNTLLGVKQNEIEQLKENLAQKTKMCDELSIRCEIMALWAGKGKTLARMKVLQFKCFNALKTYKEFQKHSKQVLKNQLTNYRESVKRKVFLAWEKQYKEWKIVKNRDDFEKAVKLELQQICAQYSKEIESLRQKLDEANSIVEQENKNKAMMQENLKKAFMRGVCALNFEAMNILNPNDTNGIQNQIEREMEKQVMYAMNDIASQSNNQINTQRTVDSGVNNTQLYSNLNQPYTQIKSSTNLNALNPFDQNQSSYTYSQQDSQSEISQSEKKMFQIDNSFGTMDYKKVETKDSMWKPAPIMGTTQQTSYQNQFTGLSGTQQDLLKQKPQITQMLKQNTSDNYVLSSHFARLNEQALNSTSSQNYYSQFTNDGQSTEDKILFNNQLNYPSSSLPDFVSQPVQSTIANPKTPKPQNP